MEITINRKCIKCGRMFKDEYENLNGLNVRVWCNSCVDEKWEENKKLNYRRFIKMNNRHCGRLGKCRDCGREMTLKKRLFGLLRFRSCSCGYKARF